MQLADDRPGTRRARHPIPQPTWARSGRWFGIDTGSQAFGLFCGCLLAFAASISFEWSRVGILGGMVAADLCLLRFVVAGVIWFVGLPHLRSLPIETIILQGVLGIVGYSHAIRVLGVSRAVLFPASIPAVSILIGIPILGEFPYPEQIAGVALVTIGLLTAIGVFHRRRPRRSRLTSIRPIPYPAMEPTIQVPRKFQKETR